MRSFSPRASKCWSHRTALAELLAAIPAAHGVDADGTTGPGAGSALDAVEPTIQMRVDLRNLVRVLVTVRLLQRRHDALFIMLVKFVLHGLFLFRFLILGSFALGRLLFRRLFLRALPLARVLLLGLAPARVIVEDARGIQVDLLARGVGEGRLEAVLLVIRQGDGRAALGVADTILGDKGITLISGSNTSPALTDPGRKQLVGLKVPTVPARPVDE